jgi:hypothetical protein
VVAEATVVVFAAIAIAVVYHSRIPTGLVAAADNYEAAVAATLSSISSVAVDRVSRK